MELRRAAPVVLTLAFAGVCWSFARGGQHWLGDEAMALAEARARGTLVLVHVSTPGRPHDLALRRMLADERLARSFVTLRLPADDAARVLRLCGEPAAVALAVVAPEAGPLGTWYGGTAAELAGFLRQALAEAGRGPRGTGVGAIFARVELHEALASPALAERALAEITTHPAASSAERADAFAALARLHAEAAALDRARAALAECARTRPERVLGPDCVVTEALLATHALQPAAALSRLEACSVPPRDRALAALVRADALHQLGRAGESLAVLHEVLADGAATRFHDTARARIAHLISPDHGHSH